jgi:predicted peptidase
MRTHLPKSQSLGRLLTTALIMVSLTGCSAENAPLDPEVLEITYTYRSTDLVIGDQTLRYALATPNNYSPDTASPLTLALHFGGEVTPDLGRDFLTGFIEPALGQLGSILVAPNCPSGDGWTDPGNVALVLALVDSVQAEFNIAPAQKLVIGYSLGAIGAWHFAAHYPDVFAAAIPVSGFPNLATGDDQVGIPVRVFHGRNDFSFMYGNVEQLVGDLQAQGKDVTLTTVDDAMHFDVSKFIQPLTRMVSWLREIYE